MIDRRTFARFIVAIAVLAASQACTQNATGMRRIGWLSPEAAEEAQLRKLLDLLQQSGWIEGKNLAVERQIAKDSGGLPAAAQELVRLKVDVIIADGTPAVLAAKRATTSIPIVANVGDPVALGLAASLSHPGGNFTGYSFFASERTTRRTAIAHELLPSVQRMALPLNPDNPISRLLTKEAEDAYRSLGVRTILIDMSKVESFIFEAVRQDAQAVDVPSFGADTQLMIDRAMRNRLPVVSDTTEVAQAGAVMAFDMDPNEANRRLVAIIDKVLRGASPADIPIEQPTKFQLIINMKSAKALGIVVPDSILLSADEVIR
jgi:putative ABC transport system substrate-binding protein